MSIFLILTSLALFFLVLEGIFFVYCFRWLASAKKERDRDFSKLDRDRATLVSLQNSVGQTLEDARSISQDSLAQLKRIGADAHAEWTEMLTKMHQMVEDVESQSLKIAGSAQESFQRSRLKMEKIMLESSQISITLEEKTNQARKFLQLLDATAPQETILKEIQDEKYQRAKTLLSQGMDTSEITKKLGISHSEIALLSYMR
jgi:hypothetical protein